jgi:hypothetical protein
MNELKDFKYLSVLDCHHGFFHLELTKSSSFLCVFNTPFGKYKFNRLAQGISSSPEIYQRHNMKLFGHIAQVYFDDIIIGAKTKEEHDLKLKQVLEIARKNNVRFNKKKFQYCQSEVEYLGHVIGNNNIKKDKEFIQAVLDLKTPTTITELRRILGMITAVSNFIPNAASLTNPLRQLLKKDVPFMWTNDHDSALNRIKNVLISEPVLKMFDSNKPITIEADSSKDTLGICLLQDNHPIQYASRSLTPTEQRWAQIEKELMAICFAFKKFHDLVYGREVKVKTDHKPLIYLIKKPIHKVSSRLQKMILFLLKYSFELTYVPGKKLLIADTLSRDVDNNSNNVNNDEFLYIKEIHEVTLKSHPMTKNKVTEFQEATSKDNVLKIVKSFVEQGWPKDKKKIQDNVKHYFKIRNDLALEDGILFLNDKLVVPNELRMQMLKLLHESHLGIEKTRRRARTL